MGTFGDKFRKAREKQSLSFDDVSKVIKIGSRMLQAIEAENFDQLPGGVFNKGFIRAYAKHLGLNDEDAVTEYLECMRQAQLEAQAAWQSQNSAAASEKRTASTAAKNSNTAKKPLHRTQTDTDEVELPGLQLPRAEHVRPPRSKHLSPRENGIPWRIVAVSALILALVVVLWSRRSRVPHSEPVTASAAPVPVQTPPTTPATTTVQQSTPATSPPPKPQSAATGPGAPTTHAETARPDASKAAPMTLVIRATENSWISVTADGVIVSAETLIAPAHTSIRANREIVVKTGNAAGVTFVWNGKEVPAQGEEAEVKTLLFDAGGYQVLPPTQPAPENRQP